MRKRNLPKPRRLRHRLFGFERLDQRIVFSIEAVSLRSDGLDTGNVAATFSQQSADGRYVVFRSSATNLVSGVNDVNGFNSDIYRRDRLTGKTELVSVSRFNANQTPDHPSFNAYISANGRYVIFESDATDLVANDNNFVSDFEPGRDVFVRDMVAKKTILVSVNRSGNTTVRANNTIRESDQTDGRFISDDGRFIVFQSEASDLVANDNNFQRDVFVRDIVANKTYLVNQNNAGQAGNGPSDHGVISSDGRYVAFESRSMNLVANDNNFNGKIFRFDLQTSTTQLVSNHDLQSPFLESGGSFLPKISSDGNVVVFESFRRLAAADADNANRDVYVRDMRKSAPDLVSISATGQAANSTSFSPNISDDGHYVVFESLASNLTTTDGDPSQPNDLVDLDNKDVFRRNLVTGVTELVSFDLSNGKSAQLESRNIHVSGDGRFVTWESQSRNLVPNFHELNDTVFAFDIFRRDMDTRKTTLVSGSHGSVNNSSNNGANFPVISRDGRYISFHSTSDDLVSTDTNSGNGGHQTDVFVSGADYKPSPTGTAQADDFVLTFSGAAPNGTVLITVASAGGTPKSLGRFPLDTPITLSGGGGTDSVTIVGRDTKDTFLVSESGVTVNGTSIKLDSIETRSLLGQAGDDSYLFDTDSPLGSYLLDDSSGIDTISFAPTTTTDVALSLGKTTAQTVNANLKLTLRSSIAFENVIGGAKNDVLTGNRLANTLNGGLGNDVLDGGLGSDLLIGGRGNDRYVFTAATGALETDTVSEDVGKGIDFIDFSALTIPVQLNIGITAAQTVHGQRKIRLTSGSSIENVLGGSGDDILIGNSLSNTLNGHDGNDILVGNGGNDKLFGGAGRDLLIGGLGLDLLNGGTDDDLLIAGRTTSDGAAARLATIRNEWISAAAYQTRVNHIRAGVGNPVVAFKARSTVLDDNHEKDTLIGGAGTDWFFRAADDVLTDLIAGELIDNL